MFNFLFSIWTLDLALIFKVSDVQTRVPHALRKLRCIFYLCHKMFKGVGSLCAFPNPIHTTSPFYKDVDERFLIVPFTIFQNPSTNHLVPSLAKLIDLEASRRQWLYKTTHLEVKNGVSKVSIIHLGSYKLLPLLLLQITH